MIQWSHGLQTAPYQNCCLGGNLRFQEEFPEYKVLKNERNECFLFFTSGGVIAKTRSLPLGERGVKAIKSLDTVLISVAPGLFACGCSIVIEKR